MEAANWNGANIHRTSLQARPAQRGVAPVREAAPARAGDGGPGRGRPADDRAVRRARCCRARSTSAARGPSRATIRLREARIDRLLGAPIPRRALRGDPRGARVRHRADAADGLDVTVPAFRRADVTREADLIEEVARLDGLEKLPATLPSRHGASGAAHRAPAAAPPRGRRAHRPGPARDRGLELHRPGARRPPAAAGPPAVELQNPMSAEQSQLRTTLLGSLLDVAQRNRARGAASGPAVRGRRGVPARIRARPARRALPRGALLIGPVRPATWRDPTRRRPTSSPPRACFTGCSTRCGCRGACQPAARAVPAPGPRPPIVVVDGRAVGWLGEIHPQVAAEWDLGDTVAAFELDLDAVPEPADAAVRGRHELPRGARGPRRGRRRGGQRRPGARRWCGAGAAPARGAPRCSTSTAIRAARAGNVSLALRLAYRAPDRTLTDEEVAARREAIVAALAERAGGEAPCLLACRCSERPGSPAR